MQKKVGPPGFEPGTPTYLSLSGQAIAFAPR